jgi:hypothetical protein
MFVAISDQLAGTSTSFCSKMTFVLVVGDDRVPELQSTVS